MTILNEIRSDMKRLGFRADFKPTLRPKGAWRLSLVRNDLDRPEGYYKDFEADKVDDMNYLSQWLLIMYVESVRDRLRGYRTTRKNYSQFNASPKIGSIYPNA